MTKASVVSFPLIVPAPATSAQELGSQVAVMRSISELKSWELGFFVVCHCGVELHGLDPAPAVCPTWNCPPCSPPADGTLYCPATLDPTGRPPLGNIVIG